MDNETNKTTTITESQIDVSLEPRIDEDFLTLKRHHYPLSIKIFILLILQIFIMTTYSFFKNDFKSHLKIYREIFAADNAFRTENYFIAIKIYNDLLTKYPSFDRAKIGLAKTFFRLTKFDEKYYECGLYYLQNVKCPDSTIKAMADCLPDKFKENFIKLFYEVNMFKD